MVSVDKVYQKVLALANKEQRGYITPQEFNLFADHAQMEIFEQYFYDSNQFKRVPGNDSELHDMIDLIDEKLYSFKKSIPVTDATSIGLSTYRLGDVYLNQPGGIQANAYNPVGEIVCVEEIKYEDIIKTQNSPLTRATNSRPVYWVESGKMYFIPKTPPNNGSYVAQYIVKPTKPNWTYLIGNNQSALYNPDAFDHQDFELHASEEKNLVIKILQLAGVSMKDYNLVQLAGQKEVSTKQQEKQ